MKYVITKFKSLEVALKELERFVRKGHPLSTGKRFRKFNDMLPREALVNWLLCVTLNEDRADGRSFTFSSDPLGGDGLIIDDATGEAVAQTEHVMVANRGDHDDADLKTRILKKIEDKRAKGETYAAGKTLVVFLNADGGNGLWIPNEIARQLPDPLYFKAVWIVGLQKVEEGEYVYHVVHLDISDDDAPIMRVRVARNFTSWTATRVN
jgi:hypothetical protein